MLCSQRTFGPGQGLLQPVDLRFVDAPELQLFSAEPAQFLLSQFQRLRLSAPAQLQDGSWVPAFAGMTTEKKFSN